MNLNEAVERAIQECIREGILKDFLEKHRTEAKTMSIFEYDQEKHMRMEREEAMEDERNRIVQKLLCHGMSEEELMMALDLSREELEKCKEKN